MIGILNNEALGLIAIQSVLAVKPRLNIANSYIIAPLLFDKKIRGYLKRKTTNVLSAQEIVTARNDYFIGFNEKFIDSLIVSTNAIAMGLELKLFDLEGRYLIEVVPPSIEKGEAGRKVNDILLASENVSKMLSEPPVSLYALLRIEV
ncbi:three component ABC system middle component [Neptunomonas japonica]|uniref:three component ABC system middle component n=1 Tax=Neptunomonas japonica TaxID=417574 RepID=UPI00048DA61C|nr:three component ABC system middle component [Neptunomonas japonica]